MRWPLDRMKGEFGVRRAETVAPGSDRGPGTFELNMSGPASHQRPLRLQYLRVNLKQQLDHNGDIMTPSRATPAGDRILEPMIALARLSKQHRIVVAMLARQPRQTAAIQPASTTSRWSIGGGARSKPSRSRLIGWWNS